VLIGEDLLMSAVLATIRAQLAQKFRVLLADQFDREETQTLDALPEESWLQRLFENAEIW
jgi:hypothetical protein